MDMCESVHMDMQSMSVNPSQKKSSSMLTLVGMRADRRKARHDVSTCNTKADVGISTTNGPEGFQPHCLTSKTLIP